MLIKAILMHASCSLAAGVVSNLPDDRKSDPDITDPQTRADNLQAFRVAHVIYDGLCRAMDRAAGWQTPPELDASVLSGTGPLASLAETVLGQVAKGGPLQQLLADLVKAIPRPAPAPSAPPAGPIPSPADTLPR